MAKLIINFDLLFIYIHNRNDVSMSTFSRRKQV